MFGTSCVLLCVAVGLSRQAVFTYINPWDPFRRSNTECEMCYNNNCFLTSEARCDYYAASSKVLWDNDDEDHMDEIERTFDNNTTGQVVGKIDAMIYEHVDRATSTSMFKICVPFISQYTDCTEENICTGCKFCTCNEEGRWTCAKKQQCRPGPRVNIDHRVIGIVVDSLNRKKELHNKRYKRSAVIKDTSEKKKDRLTYNDISEWLYETPSLNLEDKTIDTVDILEHVSENLTADNEYKNTGDDTPSNIAKRNAPMSKNDIDILEFNDILKNWAINDMSTNKPLQDIDSTKIYLKRNGGSLDLTEFDPIRLIKRDTAQIVTNQTQLNKEINSTRSTFANVPIIKDALYGLSRIIDEKERELEELLNIQENLLQIAKSHNTSIDVNVSNSPDSNNNHQIAIYKINSFDKCMAKLKHVMYNAIENIIKTEISRNSTGLSTDLRVLLKIMKKYIFHNHHDNLNKEYNILSSQESKQDLRRYMHPDHNYEIFDPITYLSKILTEISKVPKPFGTLSQHVRKLLKRVIIQLYFEDFAVIDVIVHETQYNFNNYLESIGVKWEKMMQDITESETSDKLYRTKLLHFTLKTDISKIEDMISVLEFAKNRRMTVTNSEAIEKSVMKIKNNLKLIDSKVQEIIKLQNIKRMRKTATIENNKPVKKLSMIQKLKKIFQNSRNDIKNMLRKKMPKSEIMKEIAKKKIDEFEKQRMLEYQTTMNQWQDKLNIGSGRRKRSAWGFGNIFDRIKSIIPGYLKKKVKPAIHSRKANKTRAAKKHGRKMKHKTISTTVRTSHKDRINQNKTLNG